MLGPPVCETCELIGDYHPDKTNPNKQGDWLCPKCKNECNRHLFDYLHSYQNMILLSTTIYKENKGHSVS